MSSVDGVEDTGRTVQVPTEEDAEMLEHEPADEAESDHEVPLEDGCEGKRLPPEVEKAWREVKRIEEDLTYRTPREDPELTSEKLQTLVKVISYIGSQVQALDSSTITHNRERTMELVRMNIKIEELKKNDRQLQGKIFSLTETHSNLLGPGGRLAALEEDSREKERNLEKMREANSSFKNSLQEINVQLKKSHEQSKQMEEMVRVISDLEGRILNEKHRLNTASSHAMEAAATAEGLHKKISTMGKGAPAQAPASTEIVPAIHDMRHQIASLWKEVSRINVHDQLQGFAKIESVTEMALRLANTEEQMKKLRETEDAMFERMATFHKKELQLRRLERELKTLSTHMEDFEHTVSNRLAAFWTQEERKAVQRFMQKWGTDDQTGENLKPFLAGWWAVVRQHKRVRIKGYHLRQKTAEGFLHSRLKAWIGVAAWKRSRREHATLKDSIVTVGDSVAAVKATVRQNRELAGEMHDAMKDPISLLTRKLDSLNQTKAEHANVVDMCKKLEARLNNEEALGKIYLTHEEIWAAIRKLESTKGDSEKMDGLHRKAVKLALDTQSMLKKIRSELDSRATIDSISHKADAEVVEQVLVLLARHSDQLAVLVAGDLERMRTTLARFLQQSPDIRKAATSMELTRAPVLIPGDPTLGDLSKTATGTSGILYRIAPDVEDKIRAWAADKIATPTRLASALQRQGLQPVDKKSMERTLLPSTHSTRRGKIPQKVDTTSIDLKQLLQQAPGWLSGAHVAPSEVASPESLSRVTSPASQAGDSQPSPRRSSLRRHTSPRVSDPFIPGRGAQLDLRDYFPASAEAALTPGGADRPQSPSSCINSAGLDVTIDNQTTPQPPRVTADASSRPRSALGRSEETMDSSGSPSGDVDVRVQPSRPPDVVVKHRPSVTFKEDPEES